MNLEEAQARLKKTKINEEQLQSIDALYILLDLDKDDFCKIVDTIGLNKLINKKRHYERLQKAEMELTAKENYLKAKVRLEELEIEKEKLEKVVKSYNVV